MHPWEEKGENSGVGGFSAKKHQKAKDFEEGGPTGSGESHWVLRNTSPDLHGWKFLRRAKLVGKRDDEVPPSTDPIGRISPFFAGFSTGKGTRQ